MKRTFLDKLIGAFSPEAELKRLRARGRTEFLQRSYDAAFSYKTDDWRSATKGSANSETQGAQETLRAKGREAIRNNPYAGRAVSAIVSNTVGAGIVPNIKAKSRLQKKKITEAWKKWAETPRCDSQGKHNFYSMQALALRSVIESGEILTLKEINSGVGHQLRLLESDYIVSTKQTLGNKNNDDRIIQGIRVDKNGRPVSYYLYETHPGDLRVSLKELEVDKSRICHVYRQDRPDQLRGVSWFHPVIRTLNDFNEYQQATLIGRKVSACFAAFITVNDADSTLSASDLLAKREAENMLAPGNIRYLNQGENVQIASPPAVQGYDEYCRQTLRAIASGMGITYEALTSDYSQVNFSSGRMGHLEFRRNVEHWRWSMLIPQFCEPAFEHFLQWCQFSEGIPVEGVTCEWVPPAWSMIDPTKEIAAMSDAVRSGLITFPKAVLELGYDPEQHLSEISENNKRLDELEIILDSDPRKTTKAGLFQVDSSQNSQQGNNTDVKDTEEVPKDGTPSDSSDG
jgi:lambda family phage portal protein